MIANRRAVNRRAVSRRRLFQALALTSGCGTSAAAAAPIMSLDLLRGASAAHGINLADDRLRLLQPVLEKSLPQMRALREFEIDDAVAPTQGILGA
jgi:hypothetical protein